MDRKEAEKIIDEYVSKQDNKEYTFILTKMTVDEIMIALMYGANKLEEEDESDPTILVWRNISEFLKKTMEVTNAK